MILWLRLAAFIFLIWVVYKLVRGIVLKALSKFESFQSGAPSQIEEMVQDPVCGSYISADHAVSGEFGGKRLLFCSDKCLNEYKEKNSGD